MSGKHKVLNDNPFSPISHPNGIGKAIAEALVMDIIFEHLESPDARKAIKQDIECLSDNPDCKIQNGVKSRSSLRQRDSMTKDHWYTVSESFLDRLGQLKDML